MNFMTDDKRSFGLWVWRCVRVFCVFVETTSLYECALLCSNAAVYTSHRCLSRRHFTEAIYTNLCRLLSSWWWCVVYILPLSKGSLYMAFVCVFQPQEYYVMFTLVRLLCFSLSVQLFLFRLCDWLSFCFTCVVLRVYSNTCILWTNIDWHGFYMFPLFLYSRHVRRTTDRASDREHKCAPTQNKTHEAMA